MKNYISLLLGLCFLSSCHSSEKGTSFHSQQQYRHRLFKGGYETIRFKPDGKVYVELLENGITIKANGDYQRDKNQVKLALLTGPRRSISFWQLPSNELLDLDKNNRWENF